MADNPYDARPWLAHYDAEVPQAPALEPLSLPDLLDRSLAAHPERPAVLFRQLRQSYAELGRASDTLAGGFHGLGVRPGDRVALMLPNLPQTIAAYFGVLKAGGVVVMTNPAYMAAELLHQLRDAQAETLVVLDLLWPKVAPLLPQLPVRRVIVTTLAQALPVPWRWLAALALRRKGKVVDVPYDGQRILRWSDVAASATVYRHRVTDPGQETALLQYTGGTTGVAKGCMLTHANLVANTCQCRAVLHAMGHQPEIFLGVPPYFHVYGLTVCLNFPVSIGAALAPLPRFDPAEVVATIRQHRPSIFPGAPSIYTALFQRNDFAQLDFSALRFCISGSAPMPQAALERFAAITQAEILEGFGLTEASPVTHLNPINGPRKPGSVGLPFPLTEARIVDPDGSVHDLRPVGQAGELCLRGPQVMRGYWGRPEDTAEVLQDGWLRTGDIATMDAEGYFFIVDRKKDLIITSGYNVYPREVDEVLHTHPNIAEAVTVGLPHATRGEVVKVYVVIREGQSLTKTDVLDFCRERLAAYKVPRQVEFRESLPRNVMGKILRRVLRDEELAKVQGRKPATA